MVWLIPYLSQRLTTMPLNGTLLNCPQAQPKDVGQCKPIHVFYAMQNLVLADMTPLFQLTKG